MSSEEKEKRNNEMRENLQENNIYLWALRFIRNTLRWNDDEE
jgi:trehalose-6-phosphate synthase